MHRIVIYFLGVIMEFNQILNETTYLQKLNMFTGKEHIYTCTGKSGRLKLGKRQKGHWTMFQLKGKCDRGKQEFH